MSASEYRPGPGWKHLGGAVYEHASGVRIHVAGLCGKQGGEPVVVNRWPVSSELNRFVRIAGGNRRRGMMAFAFRLMREQSGDFQGRPESEGD